MLFRSIQKDDETKPHKKAEKTIERYNVLIDKEIEANDNMNPADAEASVQEKYPELSEAYELAIESQI